MFDLSIILQGKWVVFPVKRLCFNFVQIIEMKKADIIKSWYPNEVLSDDEALAIYDRLLKLYLTLYYADKENRENKI